VLAIIAPGQGGQTPGFLSPWVEDSNLGDLLSTWSETIELDLFRLGTSADADEIRDTANAQPLIVAAGLLALTALGSEFSFSVAAGHSVGEITAAAIAEVFSYGTAMALVRERGLVMAVAAAQSHTGMSAVLGGERSTVLAAIADLGLVAANDNGAGQIVAAGDLVALAQLRENPPAGARVRALEVAGAFHTPYMQSAFSHLADFAQSLPVKNPMLTLISNKDGEKVHTGAGVLDRIVNQIVSPVRWDLCMKKMGELGVTAIIEVPPAGTLVGIIKRALPGVQTLALKSPADLDAARELIARHSGKIGVL
jgi:[acyl-carrier-protein] S-malonyltransferase